MSENKLSGFSADIPYEICRKYAEGKISHEQLLDELKRFPYVPIERTIADWDDLVYIDKRSFESVVDAANNGLIDGKTYNEIVMNLP